MTWFKQLGDWVGNSPYNDKVSVEVSTQQLLASLLTMAWFVEARDPYTGGHLWRVSRYARLLAEHAKFSNADAARIGMGGFLHDLGKIGIPDAILRKPDRLTEDEYTVIKLTLISACACWPATLWPRWSRRPSSCTMNARTDKVIPCACRASRFLKWPELWASATPSMR